MTFICFKQKWLLWVMVVVAVTGLSACKVDLYTGLTEDRANDMMAILLRHEIDASKTTGKGDLMAIRVDETRFADAIEILKSRGYPKRDYDSIGDVFKRDGLISSPTEERLRFIYALSQELADTISRIEGVLDSRVHVMLPTSEDEGAEHSSAAVFVRHMRDAPIDQSVPDIKTLVTNSIEGLEYDKVSVILFPSEQQEEFTRPASMVPVFGIMVDGASADRLRYIVFTSMLFVAILSILIGLSLSYFFGARIALAFSRSA